MNGDSAAPPWLAVCLTRHGVPAYARPVRLFGTAGDAASAYLPGARGCALFRAGRGAEPQVAGTVCVAAQADGRFAALKALPACGHVLVIAAPFALTEQDALYHLVAARDTAAGYGVSVLAAEQQGFDAEGQPLPHD